MIDFFKPEDFILDIDFGTHKQKFSGPITLYEAKVRANAKLEREGKIVYGVPDHQDKPGLTFNDKYSPVSHQAILIDIKPIKNPCEHTKEKVKLMSVNINFINEDCYKCECGARVEPESFKEVK